MRPNLYSKVKHQGKMLSVQSIKSRCLSSNAGATIRSSRIAVIHPTYQARMCRTRCSIDMKTPHDSTLATKLVAASSCAVLFQTGECSVGKLFRFKSLLIGTMMTLPQRDSDFCYKTYQQREGKFARKVIKVDEKYKRQSNRELMFTREPS